MEPNNFGSNYKDLPEIPESWEWWRLGELVDQKRGICYGIVQPGRHDPEGVPMINSQDVLDGVVAQNVNFKVSQSLHRKFKRSTIRGGEILLTLVGANFGRAAIAPQRYSGFNCSRAVGLIPVSTNPKYVMYCLRSPLARRCMDNWANTTAQPTFNLKDVANLPIPLPPLSEQKRIADILGTLDDKIELNRRMNATLEAMAQALYQSWFVDFEPVKRNSEGEEQRPEDYLFSDSFEDSAVGDIPVGWTVERVGDVVDCVGGGTPSTKEPKFWDDGAHHWTTPKDFSSLQSPILIDTSRKLTDAGIAKISSGLLAAGTLLLSSRAPVGYLAISAIPVAVNQGFIAMKCSDRASNYFMLNWCQANMGEIKSRATGTTFPEISKNSFRPILAVLPPKEVMAEFTVRVAPLYAQITANLHQSSTLSKIRDMLLPKLLSGQITF